MRRESLSFLLVVVVSTLVSCSSGASKGSTPVEGASLQQLLSVESSAETGSRFEVSFQKCMSKSGFKYWTAIRTTPLDRFRDRNGFVDQATFFRSEGFNIFTNLDEASTPDPGSQKNESYLNSLDPATRSAYFLAAVGREEGTQSPSKTSCSTKAQEATYGPNREVLRAASDGLAEIEAKVDADPAVVAEFRDWTKCVRKLSGLTFGSQKDISDFLVEKYNAIVGQAPSPFQNQQQALNEGAALERELAVAAADCEDLHLKTRRELLNEAEHVLFLNFRQELLKVPFLN